MRFITAGLLEDEGLVERANWFQYCLLVRRFECWMENQMQEYLLLVSPLLDDQNVGDSIVPAPWLINFHGFSPLASPVRAHGVVILLFGDVCNERSLNEAMRGRTVNYYV